MPAIIATGHAPNNTAIPDTIRAIPPNNSSTPLRLLVTSSSSSLLIPCAVKNTPPIISANPPRYCAIVLSAGKIIASTTSPKVPAPCVTYKSDCPISVKAVFNGVKKLVNPSAVCNLDIPCATLPTNNAEPIISSAVCIFSRFVYPSLSFQVTFPVSASTCFVKPSQVIILSLICCALLSTLSNCDL